MSHGDNKPLPEIELPLAGGFSPYCSDNDSWGSLPNSPCSDSSLFSLEINMDQTLAQLMQEELNLSPKPTEYAKRKKRGRKPLRPNDPIKKKTEEKDKYWLRAFRAYMKGHFATIKHLLNEDECLFWVDYLGHNGKPEKGRTYLSYGKRYKNHLFSQITFVKYFKEWFEVYGYDEICKKCRPGSPRWVVFYNYACEELMNYIPRGCSSINGRNSPIQGENNLIDVDEFYMLLEDDTSTDNFKL